MSDRGALRFARFAVPPNQRGYCGPDRQGELAAYRAEELTIDRGLVEMAREFEGAWPYLELLAGAARTDDPLDDRVVQAYWIGNELCDQVTTSDLGWHLIDRFRSRAGSEAERVTSGVGRGARPHHSFHVFCVYPWVGLLREGRGGTDPLGIIQECHISWGRVCERSGDDLLIEGPELRWDDGRLTLDGAIRRLVWLDPRLATLASNIDIGSEVAVHWGQVVDVLDRRQHQWLEAVTRAQIAVANGAGLPVLG